jgi:hypothetical protein
VAGVRDIVDIFMASRRDAGQLVALDIDHGLRISVMHSALLKASCPQMAVQALPVVVWVIKLDGLLRSGKVLRINMVKPADLGSEPAVN